MWLSPKAQKSLFAKSLSKIDSAILIFIQQQHFSFSMELDRGGRMFQALREAFWVPWAALLGDLYGALLADVSCSCRLGWSWGNVVSTAQCAQPTCARGCWSELLLQPWHGDKHTPRVAGLGSGATCQQQLCQHSLCCAAPGAADCN